MTKKEMLEGMGIEATKGKLSIKKKNVERFFNYYLKQEDKDTARKFILQFMPR